MRPFPRSAIAVLAGLAALAASGDSLIELPHHDWAMVAPDHGEPALLKLLSGLEAGLESAGLEPGFPKRCRFARTAAKGAVAEKTCREPLAEDPANGLLIDERGAFLEVALVDFPDTRVYLLEVYLLREAVPRGSRLPAASRVRTPRLTVTFPLLDRTTLEALPALTRGLELVGAVPVEIESPSES